MTESDWKTPTMSIEQLRAIIAALVKFALRCGLAPADVLHELEQGATEIHGVILRDDKASDAPQYDD